MTRRLGAWDCPYCGNKTILGNVFDCPGCGRPRPKGIQFYEIINAPVVTPEIAAQLGSGGPNWYCEHCDSGNKDSNITCWKCGAPRGSSPSHKVVYYKQGETPYSESDALAGTPGGKPWEDPIPLSTVPISPLRPEQRTGTSPDPLPSDDDTSLPRYILKSLLPEGANLKVVSIAIGSLILLVVLTVLIYQFFFNTNIITSQVTGYRWTQNVTVQEFQVVHESSWSNHPLEAYNIEKDYRDTGRDEKIHDGWTTVSYIDTCYRTESYSDTCTRSVYNSKTCTGSRNNGDGTFSSYTYECGSSDTESYSCNKNREVPYSCTKTRQEEIYHYEDIYDWYFTYDINRWITIANYPTSGNNHSPYYEEIVLENPYDGGITQLGQQQKIEQLGTYTVSFVCNNKKVGDNGTFSKNYSLKDWRLFIQEKDYEIKINAFNSILSYPDPNPNEQ